LFHWRPRARAQLAFAVLAAAATAASLSAPPQASAGEPYMDGIDVSRWQGKPKWGEAKAAGVRFVIAKATQGNDLVDPKYERNRSRLRANKIPFTAYHYAGPDASSGDAAAEADHFVDTARLDGYNLLPVLDLERHNDMSPEALADWVKAWLQRVEERLDVKAMIYTSPAFWVEHMADTTWFADNGYRLWIAHWNVETPTVPAANWGGNGWTLWQHAVMGGLAGFTGKVDRDRFNGETLAPIRIRNNR
jgi:GH25 family lysozyme M1 (1,4-beta-N-acetylmuramidase)